MIRPSQQALRFDMFWAKIRRSDQKLRLIVLSLPDKIMILTLVLGRIEKRLSKAWKLKFELQEPNSYRRDLRFDMLWAENWRSGLKSKKIWTKLKTIITFDPTVSFQPIIYQNDRLGKTFDLLCSGLKSDGQIESYD